MKHVVLPTDFSIRSLQSVHNVMRHYRPEEKIRISLLHLLCPPGAIGDLLFRLRRTDDRYPIPQEFKEACEMMTNHYGGRLSFMTPVIRYGCTTAFLENLVEGMQADAVFIQTGYKEEAPFKDSIAILPLLKRGRFNLIETSRQPHSQSRRVSTIGDLLLAAE
jgi:hypothetical protein